MNSNLQLIIDDIKKLWNNLDLNQKFSVTALVLVAIVASMFFIVQATQPNWTVLYSDLSEPDVIAIAESLKKSGYAYKISEDKRAILVAADKKDELRMHVAENDLIEDSAPGFDLLDDLQLGSTDFKNKLTKQRIFQGELTRSIEKLNGVSKARVQLAEPERSVFADEDEAPSASVMLILEPGYKIKASQVSAIKNLVAYSIPRLTPDKVFLTDQYGNILSEDVSKNSSDMQSYRTAFEKEAAKKIKDTERLQQLSNEVMGMAGYINLLASYHSNDTVVVSVFPKGLLYDDGEIIDNSFYDKIYDLSVFPPKVKREFMAGAILKKKNGLDEFYTRDEIVESFNDTKKSGIKK